MTHPYFKLRWHPAQFADQQSRLRSLLIAAARGIPAAKGVDHGVGAPDSQNMYEGSEYVLTPH